YRQRAKVGFLRHFFSILFVLVCVSCGKTPKPSSQPAQAVFKPYRFDDEHQSSATVSASAVPSTALMADPATWQNFVSEKDITWTLLRGRIGFRQGELIVKGDGSTPVILAPK